MGKDDRLYEILQDGLWHSGEQLAEELGVSRTAIWKLISGFRSRGLVVESVRGKGYRLSTPLSLFDQSQIVSKLDLAARLKLPEILLHSEVDSTNDVCLREILSKKNNGCFVVLAEQQTAGRGRRGRHWVSPFAANIYMSVAWAFTEGVNAISGMSLVVGLAVVSALERLDYKGLALKWPNDILYCGRKVGGILLEITGDVSGACSVVIGIGINLNMNSAAATNIDQAWADLSEVKDDFVSDKNLLVAAILNELVVTLAQFERSGFETFVEQWNARDAYLGKLVTLNAGPKQVEYGVHMGVAKDGSIIVKTDNGLKLLGGGEVSLRSVD